MFLKLAVGSRTEAAFRAGTLGYCDLQGLSSPNATQVFPHRGDRSNADFCADGEETGPSDIEVPPMSKRVADILIETLQAAGVKRCYGIVGDTLNRIAHAIHESEIEWVHMRHEEAGAFAASAEAQFTGELVACAGSCGPGSLHFINGLYEANRNRAPVVLIATQVVRQDIGFNSIQEVDFEQVYKDCSVFCEMILTPAHARRMTVAACQAALTKRGVAVLVVPADISNAAAEHERPYTVHARQPVIRPSDADLDEIAGILNSSDAITIYAGAGCAGAHDEVVATAARLKAPMAHTSRGKDFVAHDNP
jgi:pyruvate dehydrogenase (quinone)